MQWHLLEQLPTELAIEVLRCAPQTLSSQLRQMPHCLSSLAALAACPGLAACCTLPIDCHHASRDAPTLILCVDVAQEDVADEAAPAYLQPTSGKHAEGLAFHRSSMRLQYDHESEIIDVDASLFSVQQRPQVVACPLLARSESLLQGTTITMPENACLVLVSGQGSLALHNAKFEGMMPF